MCCIVLNNVYLCVIKISNHQLNQKKLKIMKKQSGTLFTSLGKTTVSNLTTIVDETLATGFTVNKSKVFSAADLWNIQRNKKSLLSRRFAF